MAGETHEGLKGKLANKANGALEKRPATMEDTIKDCVAKYASLIPSHMKEGRLANIIFNEYRTTPALREASSASFFGAVIRSLQIGLEPGGALGHCYLLPFRSKGQMEVQMVLGYKGMIELIRRSGQVMSIVARPVYDGDKFDLAYGLEDKFEHVPYFMIEGAEKGELKGVTLVVKLKDGGHITDYMPLVEIEEHRKRSLAKESGPWKTDYEAMALKTIVRKNFKWLPVSAELQRDVAETDERVNRVNDKTMDVEYDIVDITTGEVPMDPAEAAAAGGGASSDTK